MTKVFLKKEKVSSKFNVLFKKNVPMNYSAELNAVEHNENPNIHIVVKESEISEFKTHNDDDNILCGGTSLQGYLKADYSDIKKIFGKPSKYFDDYKSDAEWVVEFSDGVVGTIYNYKNGKNYNGSSGTPKTQITNWNIGGNSDTDIVERINKLFSK